VLATFLPSNWESMTSPCFRPALSAGPPFGRRLSRRPRALAIPSASACYRQRSGMTNSHPSRATTFPSDQAFHDLLGHFHRNRRTRFPGSRPLRLQRMRGVDAETTSPRRLTRGPPLLPGLIAASVWIKSSKLGQPTLERPFALTMDGRGLSAPVAQTAGSRWPAPTRPLPTPRVAEPGHRQAVGVIS